MPPAEPILTELQARWGADTIRPQVTADGVPTAWVPRDSILEVLAALLEEAEAQQREAYRVARGSVAALHGRRTGEHTGRRPHTYRSQRSASRIPCGPPDGIVFCFPRGATRGGPGEP